jgi:predicted CXXCH cytochrome family protein
MYAEPGVACAACHDPVAVNHPLAPATMRLSANLCGSCHRDTKFEWENSRHGESDLTCVSCHDPHATTIRASDTSTLCADCHGTRVAAFAHSNHAEEGLTCVDCHITPTGAEPGMGNSSHNHSFSVNLNTCTQCHEYEIHNPAAAMLVSADGVSPTSEPPHSQNSGQPGAVSEAPQPANPVGFSIFAGLIGLAFGIVLAPWLERGFKRALHSSPNFKP